jgi:hypothetical protein
VLLIPVTCEENNVKIILKGVCMSSDKFVGKFSAYIKKHGGGPKDWYVGITSDPDDRLFKEHKVQINSPEYIYDNAGTEENASAVKEYLIGSLGTLGFTGSGNQSEIWIYAYKIGSATVQIIEND